MVVQTSVRDGAARLPPPLQRAHFVVDTAPHTVWDYELTKKNHEFLRGIDPGYFAYIASTHGTLLKSDDRDEQNRAAIALRIAYSQALETFCALLAAAVQAPHCALGWMLQYRNRHLEAVIGKLYREEPLYSMLPGGTSWKAISTAVHKFQLGDTEREQQLTQGFTRLWRRFAEDFLDQGSLDEYNSLKHGLRARPGGFKVAIASAQASGDPPPPEAWPAPSGSRHGSRFFTAEPLSPHQYNWKLTQRSRNWTPEDFRARLNLLTLSISNVVTFLRGTSGDASESLLLQYPMDMADFETPWVGRPGFQTMDQHSGVSAKHIRPRTGEQIRAAYPTRPHPEG